MSVINPKVQSSVIDKIWESYLREYEYWAKRIGVSLDWKLDYTENPHRPDSYKYGEVEVHKIMEAGKADPVAYLVYVIFNNNYRDWQVDGELNHDKIAYFGQQLAVRLRLIESNIDKYFTPKQFEGIIENCMSYALSQEDFMMPSLFSEYVQNFIPKNN